MGDAGNEIVGIVVGHGGHGEHLAGVDIHDDAGGAAGETQRVFQQILDAGIDGELEFGAGAGFGVVGHPDGAAFFVFDDGLAAFRSAQRGVHAGFDAGDALVVADVVIEVAGGAIGDVALFPLFEIADDMAGQRAEGILPLRPNAQIDARQIEVVFGEPGELIVVQIGAVAERNQPAVGEVMGAQVAGFEVLGQTELLQAADGAFLAILDDGDDVLFLLGPIDAVLFGEPVDFGVVLVLGEIGFADFLQVE